MAESKASLEVRRAERTWAGEQGPEGNDAAATEVADVVEREDMEEREVDVRGVEDGWYG